MEIQLGLHHSSDFVGRSAVLPHRLGRWKRRDVWKIDILHK